MSIDPTQMDKEMEEELKKRFFLSHLNTVEELKDWIRTYLGLLLPYQNISKYTEDPAEGVLFSSPLEAIWEAYDTYKKDLYKQNPGYIWMANRDGAKTLAGSILNILLITHFKAEIAHLAAVRKQAEKCLEYTNLFLRQIKPYLEHHGRKIIGDSKTKIQILNEDNTLSYIDVVVATLAGGNSQRATVGSYDELDTLSKQGYQGYKESLLIPTRKNNHGPLKIKYSTRKFSFGVFEKEIQERATTKEKLVQWNILDIAERCDDKRSQKSAGETHLRYVAKKLPMKLYTEEDKSSMSAMAQTDLKPVYLHKGCLSCPLAPVCQGHLTKKSPDQKEGPGSVYKSIDFVIGRFRETSAEMAEAQLLCWKPSSIGLVYPRFSYELGDNVVTPEQAIRLITGDEVVAPTLEQIVESLKMLEADFYAGVDFGFTNHSVIVVMAVIKAGYAFILDSYSMPGLEAHEFAEIAAEFQQKYPISKWFCDQASPATIKTFRKKGLKCPDFRKDVQDGINSVRSVIVTSTGARMLKVIKTENTKPVIDMFKEHHFLLDAVGDVTKNPDDSPGIADVGDAMRYLGQNLFSAKGKSKVMIGENVDPAQKVKEAILEPNNREEIVKNTNTELMRQEIFKRATTPTSHLSDDNIKKKRGVFWSMD